MKVVYKNKVNDEVLFSDTSPNFIPRINEIVFLDTAPTGEKIRSNASYAVKNIKNFPQAYLIFVELVFIGYV